MNKYIFEIVKGDQHLYICKGEKTQPSKLDSGYTTYLDPKPRNALRIEGFKQAQGFLNSLIKLSPKPFRKLAGVDKDWDRPIVINMRRDDESTKLIDCVASQRMYTFKEQE